MLTSSSKLKLHGFNNLTKNFSCSAYLIHYITDIEQYQNVILNNFSSKQLTLCLTAIATAIGANILNIASQEYSPQGSSVTLLIADSNEVSTIHTDCLVGHLDKSHICVHTYPEYHPSNNIFTLRIDFEISTCGVISPLKALNILMAQLNADILHLDYRVRGFTRKTNGDKVYIDHPISSIQQYLSLEHSDIYDALDINLPQNNLFSSKLLRKAFVLNNYLLEPTSQSMNARQITALLQKERKDIFYGKNS